MAPPKPVKLRESCDSCLRAKVKCSKERPLCSRCLTNGAPCAYSPSTRAGKKSRSAIAAQNSRKDPKSTPKSPQTPAEPYYAPLTKTLLGEKDHGTLESSDETFSNEATPFSHDQAAMEDSMGEQDTEMISGSDEYANTGFLSTNPLFRQADFIEPFVPMSSLNNIYSEPSTESFHALLGSASAGKDTTHSLYCSSRTSLEHMPSSGSSSPCPKLRPNASSVFSPPYPSNQHLKRVSLENSQSCDCFAGCLTNIQSLHNHSWLLSTSSQGGPDFDVVLKINEEAIESCATLLRCDKCVSRCGKSISIMMLATIFGKVMSLYRAACFVRFGSSTSAQVTARLAFGAYTVTGDNKQLLEIEILLLELRKVEGVLRMYSQSFRSAQVEKDETSIYTALVSYLDKNLQYILDFLLKRKEAHLKILSAVGS